jgi:alanine racemase
MQPADHYSCWADIDLAAIQGNVRFIRGQTGVQVMAVVKANGYGHGAVPVARAALRAGASWCGVARLEEALELRQAGLDCPLLLMGYLPPERMEQAIAEQISYTVWDIEHVQAATTAANRLNKPARLHLKVDTGMSRLGIQPQEAPQFGHVLANAPGIIFEGIFTHFARADETGVTSNDLQEDRFRAVLEALRAAGDCPPHIHAGNSAAILTRPSSYFSLVRAGIAMYGLQPSNEWLLPAGFRPALSWKAVLSQVKVVPAGRGLCYGHTYVTQGQERIGTVPAGYADGFRRVAGNQVVVGGRRAPVVARVCMDQFLVKLDGIPQAQAGDEVVLIGSQQDENISAEEVARRWETINYEVVCGISARVPRVYRA